MAELVFDLASKLTEKLGSLAYEEICLAWGVKTDLKKLAGTMSTIKSALKHAEEKQVHNTELRSWLQQLKEVFRDAEDVLDEFECEALKRQVVKIYYSTGRKVRRFFSHSNPVAFRLRVGHEIKNIREIIEKLKADKAMFDLLTDHQGDRDHDRHEPRRIMKENMTHSAIPTSGVIGRDSDKKVIVDLLMQQTVDNQSGNSQSIVSVIPIVGIGGLGKTTLAKSVYDESKDVGHFELRMWVHVSVDFDSHRLMAKILSSALDKKISDDELSVVQLQDKLRAALKDKRFFLVLDDVWNEDRLKWTDLRDVL